MSVWSMAAAALVTAALSAPAVARQTDKVTLGNDTTIAYVLVLPEGYDPSRCGVLRGNHIVPFSAES